MRSGIQGVALCGGNRVGCSFACALAFKVLHCLAASVAKVASRALLHLRFGNARWKHDLRLFRVRSGLHDFALRGGNWFDGRFARARAFKMLNCAVEAAFKVVPRALWHPRLRTVWRSYIGVVSRALWHPRFCLVRRNLC